MRSGRVALLTLTMLTSFVGSSQAELLFDNSPPFGVLATFPPGASGATLLSVDNSIMLTQIAVLDHLFANATIKFLVFEYNAGAVESDLLSPLFQTSKSFSADPGANSDLTWKVSDTLSFNLLGGHKYVVGGSPGVLQSTSLNTIVHSQNGLTEVLLSPAIMGPYPPGPDQYRIGYGYGGDTVLRLYGIAIPEPSTFALLGVGAVSLLAYAWRRRKPAA